MARPAERAEPRPAARKYRWGEGRNVVDQDYARMLARARALIREGTAHFVGGVRDGEGDIVKLVSVT
jgi:hypothetical protein